MLAAWVGDFRGEDKGDEGALPSDKLDRFAIGLKVDLEKELNFTNIAYMVGLFISST